MNEYKYTLEEAIKMMVDGKKMKNDFYKGYFYYDKTCSSLSSAFLYMSIDEISQISLKKIPENTMWREYIEPIKKGKPVLCWDDEYAFPCPGLFIQNHTPDNLYYEEHKYYICIGEDEYKDSINVKEIPEELMDQIFPNKWRELQKKVMEM